MSSGHPVTTIICGHSSKVGFHWTYSPAINQPRASDSKSNTLRHTTPLQHSAKVIIRKKRWTACSVPDLFCPIRSTLPVSHLYKWGISFLFWYINLAMDLCIIILWKWNICCAFISFYLIWFACCWCKNLSLPSNNYLNIERQQLSQLDVVKHAFHWLSAMAVENRLLCHHILMRLLQWTMIGEINTADCSFIKLSISCIIDIFRCAREFKTLSKINNFLRYQYTEQITNTLKEKKLFKNRKGSECSANTFSTKFTDINLKQNTLWNLKYRKMCEKSIWKISY